MSYASMQEKILALQADLGNGRWKRLLKPYIKPNKKKAIIQIINSFGPFLGIWILMYISTKWTWWITIPLAIVNAFFLVRIFIIQHDCGHQSFFGIKNKHINNAVGFICSMFSTVPYTYRARAHQFHHTHSGELEVRDIGDIDFLTVKEYQQLPRWRKLWYKIFRSPLVLFFFAPIVYFALLNRAPIMNFKTMTKNIKRDQVRNNIYLVGLYTSLALLIGWKPFLLIQGSIVFFFSVIAFWFFYVQHQHEETYNQRKEQRDFLSASIIGATYYKLPKLFQWLTGNIGIHHIHHLASAIPNYNLAPCIQEHKIFNKYVTTINFKESLRCIKSKLRDEDQQKMIGRSTYRKIYKSKNTI